MIFFVFLAARSPSSSIWLLTGPQDSTLHLFLVCSICHPRPGVPAYQCHGSVAHRMYSPPSSQQPDGIGQWCLLTLGSQAPQALSVDCIKNTSPLGSCDYFSNAHRCCCDLRSSNSFKSTAGFKVAYCHFAFSQTMDTQSKTSVKEGC